MMRKLANKQVEKQHGEREKNKEFQRVLLGHLQLNQICVCVCDE